MHKVVVTLAVTTAILLMGALGSYAQNSLGAASVSALSKNFTPIEKAACGPNWGRWCGPFHHRVCNRWRCWCAHC